jgi:hypothetical protein
MNMVEAGRRSWLLLIVMALAATGCAAGDGDQSVADDSAVVSTTESTIDDERASGPVDVPEAVGDGLVSSIALVSPDVEELDWVRFSGADPEADLSALELFGYSGTPEPVQFPLYLDDEGLYTTIGLHPVTPGNGGLIELQFVEGDERGPGMPIELVGLPAAPGAWDRAVELMTAELEARAVAGGSSLDQLQAADFADLDAELVIVKLVAGFVDDGSDEDLESLPTRAGFELDDDMAALLDAVIAKIDPLSIIPGERLTGPVGFAGRPTAPSLAVGRPVTTGRAVPAQAGGCMQYPLDISSGAELSAALETGIGAKRVPGGPLDKLTKDVASLAGTAGNTQDAATVGSGIGDLPGISNLIGAVDTMYSTADLWQAADAGRYPTMLTSLSAEASITEFNEDFTQDGAISNITVVAASTGFDGAEALSKISTSAVNAILGSLTGAIGSGTASRFETRVTKSAEKARDSVHGKAIKDALAGNATWCPQTWSVPLKSPAYYDMRSLRNLISVDEGSATYRPLAVGDDFVQITAQRDQFSGQSAFTDVAVSTKQIQVLTLPSQVTVKDPGEIVMITTDLFYADTTTLFWDSGPGEWNDGRLQPTNEPETRPLKTPTATSAYPFTVKIASMSTTGLRATATDERSDTVEIKLQELFVTPDPGRVAVERQLSFEARDRDGKPVAVRWEATGGSIDSNGVYTAGKTPGRYTVTATGIDNPDLTATVTVTVVELDCLVGSWTLRSEDFLDQLAALSGEGASFSYRSGEYRLEFRDDGSYTGRRDAWSFGATSPEGTLVVEISSTDPGTWSADRTTVDVIESGGGEATVSLAIEIGGELRQLPIAGTQTVGTDAFAGSGPYTCNSTTFEATFQGVTSTWDRTG